MIGDRELHKMPGNTFMSEDWSWIFDRCANIEILRFRVVGGNEKESGRGLVINTGRSYKAGGARWLESLGQLSNLKRPEIIRQSYKIVFLQEADHFCFATFIRFEE